MYVCMYAWMDEDKNQVKARQSRVDGEKNRVGGQRGRMNQDSRGPFSGQPPEDKVMMICYSVGRWYQ